jgi:hypothetical protein
LLGEAFCAIAFSPTEVIARTISLEFPGAVRDAGIDAPTEKGDRQTAAAAVATVKEKGKEREREYIGMVRYDRSLLGNCFQSVSASKCFRDIPT